MFGKKGTYFGLVFVTILGMGIGLLGAEPALAQNGASHPGKDWLAVGIIVKDGPDGALVEQVRSGSLAERAGLALNDLITAVNGQPVDAEHPVAGLLEAAGVELNWLLTIERQGQEMSIQARPETDGSKSTSPRGLRSSLSHLLDRFSFTNLLRGFNAARASGQSAQDSGLKGWPSSLPTSPQASDKAITETRGS